MGRPGNPAPLPRSATFEVFSAEAGSKAFTTGNTGERGGTSRASTVAAEEDAGNRLRAANKDSPKWRVTISSGLRTAVRLVRAFQRTSISTYIDIAESCAGLSF